MSFLYDYMTEAELVEAQENAIFENASMHLDSEFQKLRIDHEVRMNNIDTQAILENMASDDLEALYIKEQAIYMEGVAEWWDKFKKWIKGIIDAILGKTKKIPAETKQSKDEIETPVNTEKLKEVSGKAKGVVGRILDFKNDDGSLNVPKIAGAVGLTAVSGGGIAAAFTGIFKKTKTTKAQAYDDINETMDNVASINNSLDNIESKGDNAMKLVKDFFSPLTSKIQEAVNKVFPFLFKNKENNSEENKEDPKNTEGNNGEGTDDNSGENYTTNQIHGAATQIMHVINSGDITKWGGPKKVDKMTAEIASQAISAIEKANKDNQYTKYAKNINKWKKILAYVNAHDDVKFEFAWEETVGDFFTEFTDNFEEIGSDLDILLESHTEDEYEEIFTLIDAI